MLEHLREHSRQVEQGFYTSLLGVRYEVDRVLNGGAFYSPVSLQGGHDWLKVV